MNGRTAAIAEQLSRLTAAQRRLALLVLLVLGAGLLPLALPQHEEPAHSEPVSAPPTRGGPAEGASAPTTSAGATFPPVSLRIDAIGASALVDPLGLNPDGTLEVPKDFSRAGYYTGRPPPGTAGPAVIAAHVDSKAGPAVFYRLRDLKPGDEVVVTRTDGSEVVFAVDRVEQHAKDAFPTEAVYGATPGATLRLITCGGSFDRRARHYRDNLIAFATYKGLTPPPPTAA